MRNTSGVLCDKRIPIKVNGKFLQVGYKVNHALLIWVLAVKKQHINKLSVAEMRMLDGWVVVYLRIV